MCVKFKSKIEGRQNYRKNGLLGFVLALQESILMCCCSSSLDSPGLGPSSFAPIAELNIFSVQYHHVELIHSSI